MGPQLTLWKYRNVSLIPFFIVKDTLMVTKGRTYFILVPLPPLCFQRGNGQGPVPSGNGQSSPSLRRADFVSFLGYGTRYYSRACCMLYKWFISFFPFPSNPAFPSLPFSFTFSWLLPRSPAPPRGQGSEGQSLGRDAQEAAEEERREAAKRRWLVGCYSCFFGLVSWLVGWLIGWLVGWWKSISFDSEIMWNMSIAPPPRKREM